MRALILGTDFMYDADGNLVPIEINTNLGIENDIYETHKEIFYFKELFDLIESHSFKKIIYMGAMWQFNDEFKAELNKRFPDIEYETIHVSTFAITIPEIEDSPDTLVIRSSYDTNAVVDHEYCRHKINFLELIKGQDFGNNQFAYINASGELVNNINFIPDNGNQPNFILKKVFPNYNKNDYPKFFKVTNQEELDIILENLDKENYLTNFHFNDKKLLHGKIRVLRSFNLLLPPNIESIPIGSHIKTTSRKIDELSKYDPETFELSRDDRNKYVTENQSLASPKLIDTDRVVMSDGTRKTAKELQPGDKIISIDIPNPENVSLEGDRTKYNISFEEFISGSSYVVNTVVDKAKVDKFSNLCRVTFTDGTDWEDTEKSSYLVVRDDVVMFRYLSNTYGEDGIQPGDKVILIDSADETKVNAVLKEVENTEFIEVIFSGWEIEVSDKHLFLTKTEEDDDNISYVAIEHNARCIGYSPCTGDCRKPDLCAPGVNNACYCRGPL